jgi:hypothetical protein
VFFYSLTIKPREDTPQKPRDYAEMHNIKRNCCASASAEAIPTLSWPDPFSIPIFAIRKYSCCLTRFSILPQPNSLKALKPKGNHLCLCLISLPDPQSVATRVLLTADKSSVRVSESDIAPG